MSDLGSSQAKGGDEVVRSPIHLVRLAVERPQPAVDFLHARSKGVMDLIAHFWERLSQTPPLQRGDLHLVAAVSNKNGNINTQELDAGQFCGAMLYVPKAHRADVLALNEATAGAFASYIGSQGPKAVKSDNPPSAVATDAVTTTYTPSNVFSFTDASAGRASVSDLPAIQSTNGTTGGNGGSTGGGAKVPIDFLTGSAEGIAWMTPLLLPAVHRKSPARQLVNVVMQLPPTARSQPDAAVRIAKEADVPTLNRWRRLYKEERGILFDADLDAWVQTQRVFVYEQDKQVVAVAKFDLELPSLIEIGGVYTFPEFRKQGFGAKIVSDLACRIRTAGKTPTLQVDDQNSPALRLYENAGWKPMGKLARVWLTG